jgi:ABC-2 type transport system permease protein
MNKFWLVFINEYKRHVLRKRFIFAILSMPIFFGFMVLVSMLSVWVQFNDDPVGYLAPAGILENAQAALRQSDDIFSSPEFIRYADEDSAIADVRSGRIQAYFLLGENFMNNGETTLVKGTEAGANIEDDFNKFLRYNLMASFPSDLANRLSEGTNLVVRAADGSREMSVDNWLAILLPILTGILFIIAVNISGGYLLQAVVEEKENRTMEIIVTSVSPTQLMAGKVAGDLLVGLTELAAWVAFSVLALKLAPNWLPMGQSARVDPSMILVIVAIYLPAFVMIAAAMGALGATATEAREAQQVAGLFTLPIVLPFWFITSIMFDPNGKLATGLSMFPLTAPLTMPLRMAFVTVPAWQIVVTIASLIILAALMIWLAGRVFRIGMLQYGKRVSLKQIFAKRITAEGER